MLAPVTEADFGEDAQVEFGLESLRRYPAFCADLGVELREAGTLVVARDRDEAEALDRLHAFRTTLGLEAERLRPTEARRREPALAPTVRLALDVPGDRSVDPRALVAALRERVPVTTARVTQILHSDSHRGGTVELATGERRTAQHLIVATGAAGLGLDVVRPVKGQVLRQRDPNRPGLITRTIRAETTYLVPRADGRYVLGATVEERGWDATPTAGGVFELLRDMSEIVPGILEFELEEVNVGFRPGTPDNQPIIEEIDGVIHATGHWRNGILLAPQTAEVVAGLVGARVPA